MTGLLHEREFSRKTFLKGGGALIVGFSAAGAVARRAGAASGVFEVSLNQQQIDTWISINADNTASIMSGAIDVGTGAATGLLQIAGEELGMDIDQLRFVRADSAATLVGGVGDSANINGTGPQLREAAAYARQALLGLASTKLGVPVADLTVQSGVVSGGGTQVTYGDLLGGQLFNVAMPSSVPITTGLLPGQAPAKPVSQYTLVGTKAPRIDIPAKITGTFTYIQNVRVPGMQHGRIVRPAQGAYGTSATILSIDADSIRSIPNVQIVRKDNFLGVVAPLEYDAIQAAAQLKVQWLDSPLLPDDADYWTSMRELDSAGLAPASIALEEGDVDSALAGAAHVVSQTYAYPYHIHGSIGPQCCVADVTPTSATVFTGTENASSAAKNLSAILNMPTSVIRIVSFVGASGYGNDAPYDDALQSAALMSQLAGKPVRLQFMRWDEHGWDNYAPAPLQDVRAGIDTDGNLVGLDYTIFIHPQAGIFGTLTPLQLVGVTVREPAVVFGGAGGVETQHAGVPQYNVSTQRLIAKQLPLLNHYLSTGCYRSCQGPPTVFAVEQIIDELAYAAKMDPLQFRLTNMTQGNDPNFTPILPNVSPTDTSTDRWLGVLNAVAQAANWQPKVAASNLSGAAIVTGRGIALSMGQANDTRVAVVADVQVNKKTGKVSVTHIYVAQDSGLNIGPDLMANQMSGAVVHATSRVFEELGFSKTRVTSLDWVSYPILRMADSPNVTTVVVNRPDVPPRGVGEEAHPQPGAAIANAFFDATGVRMRTIPMTPARVRAILAAGGSGVAGVA